MLKIVMKIAVRRKMLVRPFYSKMWKGISSKLSISILQTMENHPNSLFT